MTATFDSGAWLELFAGTSTGRKVEDVVRGCDLIFAPSLTLMEVKGVYLREGKPWKERIEYIRRRSVVVEVDADLALIGADMKRNHGLHTVDAIVYAVAESTDTRLYTTDSHFKGLPRTVLLGKR